MNAMRILARRGAANWRHLVRLENEFERTPLDRLNERIAVPEVEIEKLKAASTSA